MDPVDPVSHPPHPIIYWRTAAFILSILILVGVVFYSWDRNHISEKSIYTGCVLQNNQVIEAQTSRPAYLILVREVLENADKQGRPEVRKEFDEQSKKLLRINLADCKKVAEDPDSLKVEQLPVDSSGRVIAPGNDG